MTIKTHIARPYARAAYEYARDHQHVLDWSVALHNAALVISTGEIAKLLNNPHFPVAQISQLILDVCATVMPPGMTHFIQLLTEKKRLDSLPEIAGLFAYFRAENERTLEVDVRTAFSLTSAQQDHLANALQARLQRKLNLNWQIDPSLIGGLIVQAGDLVIDGSVRSKLQRLGSTLKADALISH